MKKKKKIKKIKIRIPLPEKTGGFHRTGKEYIRSREKERLRKDAQG